MKRMDLVFMDAEGSANGGKKYVGGKMTAKFCNMDD